MRTRRRGTRLHWIAGRGHLASQGLKVPAMKNTRSNPLSKLLFCPGQGDLSKIDMRMDLVCYGDLIVCSAAVIDTAYVLK
jgi:hypothetical protein